ncbi:Hypothetical_protein [Hexamita inflata]|uniref:Hypothetical_protein n=1 Tax=Hexamita inflata TaxID=28002 RepID=A0AA86PKU0_9EUKA|nr:Hypothetical protein HINF_LOCUS27958 [Hexamita inflata]
MTQIQHEFKLVDCLSKLLQTESCAIQVSYKVLMLPDSIYNRIFQRMSIMLQINENIIREQFKLLATKYLTRNTFKSFEPTESLNGTRCYNLVENTPRTQSKESLKFQKLYSECLQQILQINENDNKKLCQKVVIYLQCNSSKIFWKQMSELIPEKNIKYLKEYYQNSFKRFEHQEFMTLEDKLRLKDLMNEMQTSKPAEIAEIFMEMTKDKNYFRRNVVMYIINMKNK